MSTGGQSVVGGAGLVRQLRALLDTPGSAPKLFAFDFDNTLLVSPVSPSGVGPMALHGGDSMRALLNEMVTRPDIHLCIVTARKRSAKISQLLEALDAAGLGEMFRVKLGLDEHALKGEEGESIKIKTNGRVVAAGFQKPAALAYVIDRYYPDVQQVYFFDDNVMNAFEVEQNLGALVGDYYQHKVEVAVWWVDIFCELDTVEWEMNTDFPYHPTEKKVDGKVVAAPLFEVYLKHYGVSSEEAMNRLKLYKEKHKKKDV